MFLRLAYQIPLGFEWSPSSKCSLPALPGGAAHGSSYSFSDLTCNKGSILVGALKFFLIRIDNNVLYLNGRSRYFIVNGLVISFKKYVEVDMKNYCDMKMVPLAVEEVALVTGGDCECFCSSATSWFEPDSMGLVSNEKMCEAKCAASPRKLVMFDCILKSYNPIVNFLASSSFSAKLRQQMITGKNQ